MIASHQDWMGKMYDDIWMNGFNHCMMQCGSICSGSYFTVYEGLAGSTQPLLPTSHWLPTEIADCSFDWICSSASVNTCNYIPPPTHTNVAVNSNIVELLCFAVALSSSTRPCSGLEEGCLVDVRAVKCWWWEQYCHCILWSPLTVILVLM